jgi:hypothetical protein
MPFANIDNDSIDIAFLERKFWHDCYDNINPTPLIFLRLKSKETRRKDCWHFRKVSTVDKNSIEEKFVENVISTYAVKSLNKVLVFI